MNCFKYLIYATAFVIEFSKAQESSLYQTVEAVVGQSAELPCNVTAEKEDDKLTILAWYRNGSSAAFYSRDLRDGAANQSPSGGRYRLVTSEGEDLEKLQIMVVNVSDAGYYTCLADFASSPAHKTFVHLVVIEPPSLLFVIPENSTQMAKASAGVNVSQNLGPYYIGDVVHLFCVALGGKPQTSLSWWSDQRLLKNTTKPLSELRVRCDLMYGPLQREDHGRVLTCFAQNNDKTLPLSIDITIDMHLPPELVSLRAEGSLLDGRVKEGEALSLQCRVLGARPPPHIVWKIDDSEILDLEQNITSESSQRLVVSDVQLPVSRACDEARLTCCARDVCAQHLHLTVLYPPALKIEVDEGLDNDTLTLTKGSNVRMACSWQANPAVYQMVWFHKEDIISHGKDPNHIVQPILELTSVSEEDAGEYACAATNNEGNTYSDPITIDVIYPAYCVEDSVIEYGISVNESIDLTCNVKANPEPTSFRWVMVNDAVNASTLRNHPHASLDTDNDTLRYERPLDATFSTIFCWGQNDIPVNGLPHTPCTFLITDKTTPRPPTDCQAVKNHMRDIVVKCRKGHDGGLPQKFKFYVKLENSDEQLISIMKSDPEFVIQEPSQDDYNIEIIAFNDRGESKTVKVAKEEIVDEAPEERPAAAGPPSAVANITTLALALCGGVLLVALAACGLVLCAHDRALAHAPQDPPLCAYNTEESNCETYHGSDDGSECNVRRTESFRRAVARYPSKNFDVRRTSSFHSARYVHEAEPEPAKCSDTLRHTNNCRVHSLQNISRKKDMDALCDHLVLHLPPETNYNVSRPMNTFYTMPRKMRHKVARELSDEASEITQTSDGFSLPPPPDEFTSYRAGARIKDMPSKSIPTYTTVRKSSAKENTKQYPNASSMNVVGLPSVSAGHSSVYTYPDDDHQQVNTNPFDEDST